MTTLSRDLLVSTESIHTDECGRFAEDDSCFTETRGYRQAKAILEDKHLVFISGCPGDGKSYTARRLLRDMEKEGYRRISPSNFDTWNCCIRDSDRKQIVLFDDVFGPHWFNRIRSQEVLALFGNRSFLEEKAGSLKVILTSRSLFYSTAKHQDTRMKILDEHVVDFKSEKFALSNEEKREMFTKYTSLRNIELDDAFVDQTISQSTFLHGFPYYLDYWTSRTDPMDERSFFASPYENIRADIDKLCEGNPSLMYFFFFLLLKKDVYLNNRESIINDEIRRTLDFIPDIDRLFTIKELLDCSTKMEGIYVKTCQDYLVQFKHDIIRRAVNNKIWETYPRDAIRRLPLCHVLGMYRFKGSDISANSCGPADDKKEFPVMWNECLSKRLVEELLLGNLQNVCNFPVFRRGNKQFINCFMEKAGLFPHATDEGCFSAQITERGQELNVNFNGCILFWAAYFDMEALCESLLFDSNVFKLLQSKDMSWVYIQASATLLHACKNGFKVGIILRLKELNADVKCSLNHKKDAHIYNCDHCALFDKRGEAVLSVTAKSANISEARMTQYINVFKHDCDESLQKLLKVKHRIHRQGHFQICPNTDKEQAIRRPDYNDVQYDSVENGPWDGVYSDDTAVPRHDFWANSNALVYLHHFVPGNMHDINNINETDRNGNTVLHFVSSKQCENCPENEALCAEKCHALELFMEMGSDPFAANLRHESPLRCLVTCSAEERKNIVRCFLNHISDTTNEENIPSLTSSVQTITYRSEQSDLSEDEIAEIDNDKAFQLHIACSCKRGKGDRRAKVMEVLGENMSPSVLNSDGYNPLHLLMGCRCTGKVAITKLLAKDTNLLLDVNATATDGNNAMDILSQLETNSPKVQEDINATMDILISEGASCSLTSKHKLPNNLNTLYLLVSKDAAIWSDACIMESCLRRSKDPISWKICSLLFQKSRIPVSQFEGLRSDSGADANTCSLIIGNGEVTDESSRRMHFKTVCHSLSAVQFLFRRGSYVTYRMEYLCSLLENGVHEDTLGIVRLFLLPGCLDDVDCDMLQCLMKADGEDKDIADILQLFLDSDIDIHCGTPLLTAAAHRRQRTLVMALLLNEGVPVNQTNDDGENALHVLLTSASTNWYLKGSILPAVRLLLKLGIDMNQHNTDGDTALSIAIGCLKSAKTANAVYEVIATMLEYYNANVGKRKSGNPQCNTFLIHICIREGGYNVLETVRLLLASGFDPCITDDLGRNALHCCCARMYQSSLKIFLLLISQTSIDTDAVDTTGRSALHYLVTCSQEDSLRCMQIRIHIMRLLLRKGANPESKDNEGHTVLQLLYRNRIEYAEHPDKYDMKYSHVSQEMEDVLKGTQRPPLEMKTTFDSMADEWRKRQNKDNT